MKLGELFWSKEQWSKSAETKLLTQIFPPQMLSKCQRNDNSNRTSRPVRAVCILKASSSLFSDMRSFTYSSSHQKVKMWWWSFYPVRNKAINKHRDWYPIDLKEPIFKLLKLNACNFQFIVQITLTKYKILNFQVQFLIQYRKGSDQL